MKKLNQSSLKKKEQDKMKNLPEGVISVATFFRTLVQQTLKGAGVGVIIGSGVGILAGMPLLGVVQGAKFGTGLSLIYTGVKEIVLEIIKRDNKAAWNREDSFFRNMVS